MRFIGESEPLGSAAAYAARHTAGGASPIPSLAGLRITASAEGVRLSGYDYEASTTVSVPASVAEQGEVLLPGKVFAEIIEALPPGPVDVRAHGGGVQISAGTIEFTLPTLPLDDYPELPAPPPVTGTVSAEEFGRAAARMARIASRDDVVPIFSGTLVELTPETITLAASDRYRVAVCELPWSGCAEPMQVVVPARQFAETTKGLSPKGDLALGVRTGGQWGSEALLGLADETRSSTMRLLDGTYPPMRSKIPTTFIGTLTVRTDELRAALRRVCIVADRFTAVILTIEQGTVTVGAAGDVDTRGRERVQCDLDGRGTTTSFNASYLLDGLDFLDAECVRIAFQEAVRPALMTSASQHRPGTLYVAMPRRLPG